MYSCLYCR